MKKIVINISEVTYEKFKFEAIQNKKSIPELIEERIFHKEFSKDVENAYQEWIENEYEKILKE